MPTDAQPSTAREGVGILESPPVLPTPQFTNETKREFQRQEKNNPSPDRREKVSSFFTDAKENLTRDFEGASTGKKWAMVAGGAAAIAAAAYLLKQAFDGLSGVKSWMEGKVDNVAGKTIRRTLEVALGASTVGILYEVIQGKLTPTTILETFNKGGVTGVGTLLASKVKDGTLTIGQNAWQALAPKLGLPSFESVRHSIEQGVEWLESRVDLKAAKDKVMGFCKERGIPVPDWLDKVDVKTLAADLGLDKEKADLIEKLTKWGALAGGTYLLYRWVGHKGLAINAAVLLFFIKDGKDSHASKYIIALGEKIDQIKKPLLEKLGKNCPALSFLMPDLVKKIDFSEKLSLMFDWAKDHPVTTIAAMDAAWLLRGYIASVVLGAFALAKKAAENPREAITNAAALAVLLKGRKEFIKRFIETIYDDNPKGPEAIKMMETLDTIALVNRAEGTSLLEHQIPDFVQSIIEDPLKALRFDKTIEAFQKGTFALGVDLFGKVLLMAKGFSAPFQLAGLTWESFKSLSHIYSPENKDGIVIPMVVAGLEMYVFGRVAWEGFKAYRAVTNAPLDMSKKIWTAAKAFVPGTREWCFVLRSSLIGPFIPLLKRTKAGVISSLDLQVKELRTLLQDLQENPNDANKILKKIEHISSEITTSTVFREVRELKGHVEGTRFEWKFQEHFDTAKGKFDDIKKAAAAGSADLAKIREMSEGLGIIEGKLASYKTELSVIFERFELLLKGRFSEAFALRRAQDVTEDVVKIPRYEVDEAVKGKSPENIKEEIDNLLRKKTAGTINAAEEARLKMFAAYLHPEGALKKLETSVPASELEKFPTADRAKKIEQLADEMHITQRAVESRFMQEVEEIKKLNLSADELHKRLNQLDELYTIPLGKQKAALVTKLHEAFVSLPPGMKTKAVRAAMMRLTADSLLTRITRAAKGRAKMMALMATVMFATDVAIASPEKEFTDMLEQMGPQMAQLLLDCLPFAGTLSNFYSAFSGKEFISKSNVSDAWSRTSNVIWGVVGLAGDIITVLGAIPTGSGSIWANVGLRVLKAAKSGSKIASKLLELLPKLPKIADRMGGLRPFSETLGNFIASGGRKTAKGLSQLADNQRLINGLRRVEKTGMVVGTGMLGIGAIHMVFGFAGDVPEIDRTTYQLDQEPQQQSQL